MSYEFDVTVIGGGPGGYAAAVLAGGPGKRPAWWKTASLAAPA